MDRVLIVDDDAELCELVGEYLTPEGFQMEAVHDGVKGLDRALSGEHAILVLDIMLPGMSGVDVLRRLRAQSRLPVLILTARGDDVDRIVGLEIGAVTPEEIAVAIVAEMIAVRRHATPELPSKKYEYVKSAVKAEAQDVLSEEGAAHS